MLSSDETEAGSPWRRWSGAGAGRLLLALVLGGIAGYAIGLHGNASSSSPTPSTSSAPAAGGLLDDGARCFIQVGPTALQLGMTITNTFDEAVTLTQIDEALPMGGLTAKSTQWGACGQHPPRTGPLLLNPGDTTWLSVIFNVLEPCPAPLPVDFVVTYTRQSAPQIADFNGFNDLGDVTYAGCPGPDASGGAPS